MVNSMFSYTVSKEADNSAFIKACRDLEKAVIISEKDDILIDVDGTLIQIYYSDGKKIKVVNDYSVDAVYIDSEIDLKGIIISLV